MASTTELLRTAPAVTPNAPVTTARREPEAAGAAQTPIIARFLPSLTDIAFLMPLIFIFLKLNGARLLLGDGDTGWHIRTGEWILANGRVPRTDLFSFSKPGQPWFAWEWLSDVIFALMHQRWGLAGVVLTGLTLICLTSAALFRLARRKADNGLVAIAVTLLATGGCAIHWLARPHLFTLLFFVITLHVAARAADGGVKVLACLPLLTLVWTNLHGGFFVIFLVIACYVSSDLLNAVIEANPLRRRLYMRAARPWLLAAAGCFLATLVNPYGWNLHRHLASYISDPYQFEHIREFQSVDFHSPAAVFFEPLMLIAVLTALWDARHRRFADCFLSLGWLHLAFVAQRNIPLFAIAAAPSVARGMAAALDTAADARYGRRMAQWIHTAAARLTRSCANFDETDRLWRVHLASALPLALIAALLLAPRPAGAKLSATYDPQRYPEKAVPVLLSPETHHIFADDEWGDYLIYKLYPSKQVFFDGRSDFYGDAFGEEYSKLAGLKYGWEKVLDRYGIDTAVLQPDAPLAGALKLEGEWRIVHDDGVAIVFHRAAAPQPDSLVSSSEGKSRDQAIANHVSRDRGIPIPTTRDRLIAKTTTPRRTHQ